MYQQYPLTKPQNETCSVEYENIILAIRCSKAQTIQIKYKDYFFYHIFQIFEEYTMSVSSTFCYRKSVSSTFCLKIKNEVLKPKQKLRQIQKLGIKGEKIIEGFLLKNYDKVIFNSMLKDIQFNKKLFKVPKQQQSRISQSRKKILKKNQGFKMKKGRIKAVEKLCDSIQYYTYNSFISEINFILRKTKLCQSELILKPQYLHFCSCLTHSLREFPNYIGLVHRGAQGLIFSSFFSQDQVVCFPTFLSTSKKMQIAEKFKNGSTGSILHIQSLTGKDITKFSFYPQEEEVVFQPFTYFIVEKLIKNKDQDQVWLLQLPSPESFSQNIILWVDDQPQNNVEFIEKYIDKNVQVLQLTSTKMADFWIRQFGWIVYQKQIQIRIISNMKRKQIDNENRFAGMDLLKICFNTHKIDTPILIFCKEVEEARKFLEQIQINEEQTYIVSNSVNILRQFTEFERNAI